MKTLETARTKLTLLLQGFGDEERDMRQLSIVGAHHRDEATRAEQNERTGLPFVTHARQYRPSRVTHTDLSSQTDRDVHVNRHGS